jgi:cation transport ATPase
MSERGMQGGQKCSLRLVAGLAVRVYNDPGFANPQTSPLRRNWSVPIVTVVFGALLIALGIWGRFGGSLGLWDPFRLSAPEHLSNTALIPAFVGAALVVLGLLAFKESLLKHAMHGAAAIGLLGLLAAAGRLVWSLLSKGKVEGVGGVSLVVMTLLCAVFVGLCVNSFIQARRRRRAAATVVPAP